MQDSEGSDEALAARVQQGDSEAFGELMARYEKKLSRYGHRFLADSENIEDIVQDVFISAYQNMRGFDTAQRFSPWIYRIAHNAFVNALKKHSRNPLKYFDFDTLISHGLEETPEQLEREAARMREMLEKGLSNISEKYREILILHYFEELGYKEIADVLQVPIGTVGVRLKRAREALKKAYSEIDPQYGKE